ncbi:hypothetical protein [Nesterenkonia sp. Act20]|uniref:hypothetical protein n=1 Tax=Nesterenkonia sp. Act20 TaxID=1483432 RepID=UPI001C49752B|nr:hypothetical protein [Nesterenkonia sp. Act20]
MIGWYIHHQGHGHLHRATAVAQVAAAHGLRITGLSSLPQPPDWPSAAWVQLDRDDTALPSDPAGEDPAGEGSEQVIDPTAAGALHWVPRHHQGLLRRSAQLSQWLESRRPQLIVVDVSVEVALLARLHGIPVVTVALPGDRTDPAHQLGYAISERVVGMWPEKATEIFRGADDVQALGGLSRFTPKPEDAGSSEARSAAAFTDSSTSTLRVVVLSGGGGGAVETESIAQVHRLLPTARVTVLGGGGAWEMDPWPHLERADLVLTAAGQNSIAEVAASRTPALVTALDRPHQEQRHMLSALERGPWPVVAMPAPRDDAGWELAMTQVLQLDGQEWSSWCEGAAADRFAALLQDLTDHVGADLSR